MNLQFCKMTCLQRKIKKKKKMHANLIKYQVEKKKSKKKMHANLIKYQVENCPILPGRNLISTCNRRVKSVSGGRVEISSRQAGIM